MPSVDHHTSPGVNLGNDRFYDGRAASGAGGRWLAGGTDAPHQPGARRARARNWAGERP